MPEHWLISTTPGRDARHRLPSAGRVTVGRARDATIVLDDRSVSRRHATLDWLPEAGAWRIINEAGTGGTWVNGVRMSAGVGLTLRAGDTIRIPPWDFRIVAADGSTALAGLGAGDGDVRPLALPDPATLAQHRLVLLLGAAEAIHRATSVAAARTALAEHALRATGFDGAALLRAAGETEVEVLAAAGGAGTPGGYSRTMVRRALAGEAMVGDLASSAGSAIGESLRRIDVEQAVCVPVHSGDSPGAALWLESARRRPDADLAEAAAVAGALARMAGHAIAALERSDMEHRFAVEQQLMFAGTVHALIRAIDAKDPYTRGHSDRVAMFAQLLARTAGLPDDMVARSYLCGTVHDLGKIGVPEAVLCKPGRLTDEEFARIKEHPTIGHRILADIPHLQEVLPGVLEHHEKWDGTGYPGRLAGEAISLLGRVVCVADCFDAMTSARVYRPARPVAEVLEEIRRCAGTHFDPVLAEAFAGIPVATLGSIVAPPPAPPAAGGAG
jgi:hypothetical protein